MATTLPASLAFPEVPSAAVKPPPAAAWPLAKGESLAAWVSSAPKTVPEEAEAPVRVGRNASLRPKTRRARYVGTTPWNDPPGAGCGETPVSYTHLTLPTIYSV